MSDFDHLNMTVPLFYNGSVSTPTEVGPHNLSAVLDLYAPGDGSQWLRATIATVYFAVSAVGLVGNAVVLRLLHASGGATKSAINLFVFNLAVTDLLFSAAMPLWAVDTALDYRWPFGGCACKVASFLTSLNLFASVFFLAAMSVTRYCSVASALRPSGGFASGWRRGSVAYLATALIWVGSVLAAAPRAAFAKVAQVSGDQVCLLLFPNGTYWLGLHHLLRVVAGFLIPYAVILLSYLLLLRFLCNHGNPGRGHGDLDRRRRRARARVSRSVAVVILAFCVCWLPNNVLTFWSLLVHLDAVEWSSAFYLAHTYAYPLASCLAQVNGCLNPVLYCLVRREHQRALRGLFCGATLSAGTKACLSVLGYSGGKSRDDPCIAMPLNNLRRQSGAKPAAEPPPSTTLTGAPSTTLTGAPSTTLTGAPSTTLTGAPSTKSPSLLND